MFFAIGRLWVKVMEDGATVLIIQNLVPMLLVMIYMGIRWGSSSFYVIFFLRWNWQHRIPQTIDVYLYLQIKLLMYFAGLALEALAGVISLASSEIDQSRVMLWLWNWLVVLLQYFKLRLFSWKFYMSSANSYEFSYLHYSSMVCKILVKIFSLECF